MSYEMRITNFKCASDAITLKYKLMELGIKPEDISWIHHRPKRDEKI